VVYYDSSGNFVSATSPMTGGAGQIGAVRILWGAGRSFPSTNVS
jgi:hypothetical protein